VEDVKHPERVIGHFVVLDGTRMEASYLRYAHQNGQWTYYKLPRSERKCECHDEVHRDLPTMWRCDPSVSGRLAVEKEVNRARRPHG
jgi:hypothetical protein